MDDCSSSDENINETDSSEDDSFVICSGYGKEPEYTEHEMNSLVYSDGSETSEEDEKDSNRLENLHWCSCENCVIMPSIFESKCCQETKALLNEKLNNIKCITLNEDFRILCLYTTVLDTVLIQHHRYQKKLKLKLKLKCWRISITS